jgi:hypothetical protein
MERMAKLTSGLRLKSAVCTTEVMVVAAREPEIEIACGGAPMMELAAAPPSGATIAADASAGTQLGKRYVDAAGTLELLCTKPGAGSLAARGEPLILKGAKPLPSSD